MKLPSITSLIDNAKKTATRYPLVILSGIAIAILAILLLEIDGLTENQEYTIYKTILTLIFVIPILASIQMREFMNQDSKALNTGLNIGTIIVGLMYFFIILPAQQDLAVGYEIFQVFALIGVAYLSLTSIPFIYKKDGENDFWQYNRALVEEFSITVFLAIVLFAGIALTILSIDALFDINIHDELYLETWVIIATIFSPWVFLTGTTLKLKDIKEKTKLKKLIKTLGKYIMTPLLTLYTVILYAYAAKILIIREWPEGVISSLIIGFAITGIITQIILKPYEIQESWINKARKAFYALLLPLTGMLFAAIAIRISEYGITEPRYYGILVGCWLVAMAIHFLISKRNKLKTIPISVIILLVLSLFGPWSSINISRISQTNQLESLLEEEGVLKDGVFIKGIKLEYKKSSNVKSKIRYLVQQHQIDDLPEWLSSNTSKDFAFMTKWQKENEILASLELTNQEYSPSLQYHNVMQTHNDKLYTNVTGYDYLTSINFNTYGDDTYASKTIQTDKGVITIEFDTTTQDITLTLDKSRLAKIDLTEFIEDIVKKYPTGSAPSMSKKLLTFEVENRKGKINFVIDRMFMTSEDEKATKVTTLKGEFLIELL